MRWGISFFYFTLFGKFCANNRRYYMQGVSLIGARFFYALRKEEQNMKQKIRLYNKCWGEGTCFNIFL